LIEGIYSEFDVDEYLDGKLAPVFFGSAVNNFGVQELLNCFIDIAPGPKSRETEEGPLLLMKINSVDLYLKSMPISIQGTETGLHLFAFALVSLNERKTISRPSGEKSSGFQMPLLLWHKKGNY
jgi:hypothetical protein